MRGCRGSVYQREFYPGFTGPPEAKQQQLGQKNYNISSLSSQIGALATKKRSSPTRGEENLDLNSSYNDIWIFCG